MVSVTIVEKAGSILMLVKVAETDSTGQPVVREIWMPKFIYDLAKTALENGTINFTTLLARERTVTKDLT